MSSRLAPRRDYFFQIYHQRNEVCHQSYSIGCFDSDKEALIEVARYMADQPAVSNKQIVGLVTQALNYSGFSTKASNGVNCARNSNEGSGTRMESRDRSTSRSSSPRRSSARIG